MRVIHRGEDVSEDYAAAAIETVLAGAYAGAARLPRRGEDDGAR